MRVLPVLDLMGGTVVRGIAGQREQYRPLQSRLCQSAVPLEVAEAVRSTFGCPALYVADLDAIERTGHNWQATRSLIAAGFHVWLDCGIRSAEDVQVPLTRGVGAAIVGLESVNGPGVLKQLCDEFGPDRIVFSLDLQQGQPLGHIQSWPSPDPIGIAAQAFADGIRRMIVLDLTQVGQAAGPSTLPLCRQILTQHPEFELTTGGGIRDGDDLRNVAQSGIQQVLISTALHNGALTRNDLCD